MITFISKPFCVVQCTARHQMYNRECKAPILPSLTHFNIFQFREQSKFKQIECGGFNTKKKKKPNYLQQQKHAKKITKFASNKKKNVAELNRVANGNSMNAMLRAVNTIDLDFAFIFFLV